MLNFQVARERPGELLREAERRRLTLRLREARKAPSEKLFSGETSESAKRDIEIRWGLSEDEPGIADLLELNGMPRRAAFEEPFVVAEESGEVRAAMRYQTAPKRLLLGLVVADPWAGERELAVALYAGAGVLAQELGVREIQAHSAGRANYPREAGYRRRLGGWRLEATPSSGSRAGSPTGGWGRILALSFMLATLMAMLLSAAPPAEARQEAALPAASGKIVFASDRTTGAGVVNPQGDFEIFIMNPDGTKPRQLTRNSVEDHEPVLSANGQKVAYQSYGEQTSNPQGDAEVYLVNADGSGQKNLTNSGSGVFDSRPDFAPDGQKLAYYSSGIQTSNPQGDSEVYRMSANGSGQKNLTNNKASELLEKM